MKKDDIEFLKQKKKQNQGFNKVFEYDFEKTTPLISRKRRTAPERKYNEILEDIIDSCVKLDNSKIFYTPVKKKDYPDYPDKVKQPMDLGTIKNKTKRNEYLNIESFFFDLELIAKASEIYNGAREISIITEQAFNIMEYAKRQVELKKQELEENKPDDN